MWIHGRRGVSGVLAALIILSVILFSLSAYAMYNLTVRARENAYREALRIYSERLRERLDVALAKINDTAFSLRISNRWHITSTIVELDIVGGDGDVWDIKRIGVRVPPHRGVEYVFTASSDLREVIVITALGNVFTAYLDGAGGRSFYLRISVFPDDGGYTYPLPGIHPYKPYSRVVVRAQSAEGYAFYKWVIDGADSGYTDSIEIYMDRNHSVVAYFSREGYAAGGVRSMLIPPSGVVSVYPSSSNFSYTPSSAILAIYTNHSGYLDVAVDVASLPRPMSAGIYLVPQNISSVNSSNLPGRLLGYNHAEMRVNNGTLYLVGILFVCDDPSELYRARGSYITRISFQLRGGGGIYRGGWKYVLTVTSDLLVGPELILTPTGVLNTLQYYTFASGDLKSAPSSHTEYGLLSATIGLYRTYGDKRIYRVGVKAWSSRGHLDLYILTLYRYDALDIPAYLHLAVIVSSSPIYSGLGPALLRLMFSSSGVTLAVSPAALGLGTTLPTSAVITVYKYGNLTLNCSLSYSSDAPVTVTLDKRQVSLAENFETQISAWEEGDRPSSLSYVKFVLSGDAYAYNSQALW